MNAVTDNTHRPIDIDPQLATTALYRLDPLRPLREGLTALGLDRLVVIRPIDPEASSSTGSVSVDISWSQPGTSRAEVIWTASVEPLGVSGSIVSTSVQAGAYDANGRRRLLAAWSSIGPVFESLTARYFRAVTEVAELLGEEYAEPMQRSLSAAA